jgi:toxoflavin synthase
MTNYNAIAQVYRKTKSLPIKQYSEAFTFFQVLKSVYSLAVLDVARGDGYYTRAMKRQGASRVIGVDSSHMMITYAQREEEAHPLGIEYVLGDAETMDSLGAFDPNLLLILWMSCVHVSKSSLTEGSCCRASHMPSEVSR